MACGCNKDRKCKCPYCDAELELSCFDPAFCEPCGKEIVVCKQCGTSYGKDQKVCPKCKK